MTLHEQSTFRFIRNWFIQALFLWLSLNLLVMVPYLYQVTREGYFVFFEDGTPLTVWGRFLILNREDPLPLQVLLVSFLGEWCYRQVHLRKRGWRLAGPVLTVLGLPLVFSLREAPGGDLEVNSTYFLALALLVYAYTFGYVVVREMIQTYLTNKEVRYQQARAELSALQAQLNPHFFFNSLNTIYGTALQEKADRTAESLEQLSGLLRHALHGFREDLTSIREELGFLEEYLKLQKMRLPAHEDIIVETQILYDGKPGEIVPMLLIPFLENAFKYGISIDFQCRLVLFLGVADQKLTFSLENTKLPGWAPGEGNGTGIEATRKRLALLYPNQHTLGIIESEAKYTVRLEVNLT